jgi:hypothetical protein
MKLSQSTKRKLLKLIPTTKSSNTTQTLSRKPEKYTKIWTELKILLRLEKFKQLL